MNNEHYHDLMQLWLLRLFKQRKLFMKYIGKDDRDADELLEFLGLEHTVAERREQEFHDQLNSLEGYGAPPPIHPSLASNFDSFAKMLSLRPAEKRIFEFLVLADQDCVLESCMNMVSPKTKQRYIEAVSRALAMPPREVADALGPQGRLMGCGIMEWSTSHGRIIKISTISNISQRLLSDDYSPEKVICYIVKPAPKSKLSYRDFGHIQDSLDYLRPYLRSQLKQKAGGVNIFIYGPPGTGKTELVRIIGREMRCPLYEVAYEDSDGDPVKGEQRLRSLLAAQNLMRKQKSLLLYDEAEDVFSSQSLFRPSLGSERKAWINRLLETNPVPTFWISNQHWGMDPAFLRRFDFVISLKAPPCKHRLRVFKRICHNTISEGVLRKVAATDSASPALVAKAHSIVESLISSNQSVNPDQAFMHLLKSNLKAQGHSARKIEGHGNDIPEVYGVDMLNTDVDLTQLVAGLDGNASARICLYGPPGTGKTCFGHWLARELDRPLRLRKASDLLSPYVGEAEQNIAKAFEDAITDGAVLMIDEVDSFLRDRREALRSWEVSQVNEMLTQMEYFNGIFIASTNLMEGLDQASLRRFDLKVRMDYLRMEQLRKLHTSWCRHLELGQPSTAELGRLDKLTNATPGDFANVARQHRFQRFASTHDFAEAIVRECTLKHDGAKGRMGFG